MPLTWRICLTSFCLWHNEQAWLGTLLVNSLISTVKTRVITQVHTSFSKYCPSLWFLISYWKSTQKKIDIYLSNKNHCQSTSVPTHLRNLGERHPDSFTYQPELRLNSKMSPHKLIEAHGAGQSHMFASEKQSSASGGCQCYSCKTGVRHQMWGSLLIQQWLQTLADAFCMVLNNYHAKLSPHL